MILTEMKRGARWVFKPWLVLQNPPFSCPFKHRLFSSRRLLPPHTPLLFIADHYRVYRRRKREEGNFPRGLEGKLPELVATGSQ